VGAALAVVRKAKSEAKVGMRAEVPTMTLVGPEAALAHVRSAEADLRAAGKLTGSLDYALGDEVSARDVELVAVAKPTA
jgi:valyl-tRNA synthetase